MEKRSHNAATTLLSTAGPLSALLIPSSSSRITSHTGGMVHAFSITGAAGIFSKEHETSRLLGRILCDQVRDIFGTSGFFSTDELPRYGLTEEDRRLIFHLYRKANMQRDVIVLMTYARPLSERIRDYLLNYLGLPPATP